jgi:hypothetical protein
MYLQKVISRKTFFKLVDVLKVNDENSRIRIWIRSGSRHISQRHGSGTLVVHTKLWDGFDLIRIKSPSLSVSDLSMTMAC